MARIPRRGGDGGGLFRTLERTGLRKGVSGGSKAWFYVGTGLWTARTIRRMAQRKEEILISERLEPGQRIVIANGRATLDGVELESPGGAGGRRRGRRKG